MTNKLSKAETLRKNRNNNGRPRLPLAQKRDFRMSVKFTGDEYFALQEKARLAGISVSEFVRAAMRKCEVRERIKAPQLKHLLQLTGMANNLNQIARQANAAGYLSVKRDCETIAKSIDELLNSIENDG